MNAKTKFFILAICLITFFVNLGALPTDIMESRNIITAREIVSDGCWLVPTMNGELRLAKPPLPTWVGGVVELICPRSLAAQRIPAAFMASLWTLFTLLIAKRLTRRNDFAIVTTVVFLTLYNVILMGRSATWDIYCHSFMMGAIYFLIKGLKDASSAGVWGWLIAAGAMMGLSFLSKGPVSFYALLLPFVIAFCLWWRPIKMKGKWLPLVACILTTVVVGGAYYAWLVGYHMPELQQVIHQESGAWVNHNVRPWYYYWRFFLEGGAWAPFILAAMAIPYWKKRLTQYPEYLFAVGWMLLQLVLLSLMPEKKMRYLLPMAPTVAMSVAFVLLWLIEKTRYGKATRIYMWTILGIFLVAELFLLKPIGALFGNPDAHSISLTQQDKRLQNLSFYHNANEDLRIELVYEAGRKILPLNLNDSATVAAKLPCVIVSRQPIEKEMPANVLGSLKVTNIGTFDDNKHPKSNRHYTEAFLNHVTLLEKK
ncbi:MAG: ArnT family glycosyltransferase [Prevotella sp.]|jgi:4-amino-4-deoxy-L-arabinose transferase-like glycosyltransferase